MSDLRDFEGKKVVVITTDARSFVGTLEGYDKSTNILLSNCIERIIYPEEDEENQDVPLGLYMLRGGNVVCVGEIDADLDSKIEWLKVQGNVLKDTKNPL
jgi:U6 snRNA-associated Sm-like protein LSm8